MPEKPHENFSQWRLTALIFFFFLVLVGLSCCPHCQFIFTLFLCKLTNSSLVILTPVKSRALLCVAARRQFPSLQHAPRYQQLSVKQSHGHSLQTYVEFVRFPTGKCMYFPQLHFGWLATGLRPVYIFVLP